MQKGKIVRSRSRKCSKYIQIPDLQNKEPTDFFIHCKTSNLYVEDQAQHIRLPLASHGDGTSVPEDPEATQFGSIACRHKAPGCAGDDSASLRLPRSCLEPN